MELGIGRSYFSQLETGDRQPGPLLLARFERIQTEATSGNTSEPDEGNYSFEARLKQWRAWRNITVAEAARLLGIGIVKYKELEAGREPNATNLAKFTALENDPALADLAMEHGDGRLMETSTGDAATHVSKDKTRALKVRKVPVIGWAQAGAAVVWEDVVDWDNVVSVEINDPKAIAIRVKGDSMTPLISDGDLVVVSPMEDPVNERYVVAKLAGDGVVCKQYRKMADGSVELRSLNPFYAPIVCELRDVVWMYPVARLIKNML